MKNRCKMPITATFTGVVKFTAHWCGPCKRIHSSLVQGCNEAGVEFAEVDVDDSDSDMPSLFKVTAMPTIVFLKDGVEVADLRVVGANMELIRDRLTKFSELVEPVESNQIPLPMDESARVQCLPPTVPNSQSKR